MLSLERTHFCGRFRHSQLFRVSLLCPLPPPSTLHFVYGQRHKVITSGQKWPKTVKSAWKSPLHESLTNGSYRYRFEKSVFGLFASLGSGSVETLAQVNRLYKGKETWQYKFVSIKAYKKREGLTSGWRASLKNVGERGGGKRRLTR